MFEFIFWAFAILIGIIFLVKGADILVDSGGSTARYFGVPVIIVGLTLVSFGTSLPELASSLNAVFFNKSGISVGNVIGSNIANTLLVIGVASMIKPINLDDGLLRREIPIMFIAFFLFILTLFFREKIIFIEGLILLLFFLFYLFFFSKIALKSEAKTEVEKEIKDEKYVGLKDFNLKIEVIKIVFGLIGVILGSKLLIKGSIFYMKFFSLKQGIVGLSIVAIATSLPELVASAIAAWKKESDISLGNVIGSNTFNILLVIGICSLFVPLTVSPETLLTSLVMVLVGAVFTFVMYTGNKVDRKEGFFLTISYFVFLYSLYFVI